eukprot:TRINITY_DN21926_c0_g1_i2.p1 TRINITY_DN21926_c0_g1~~TRINITY_DN21926_c0_g1_i2.p1  ORF type:complete len:127 (-),score=10.87 TRINITY_DN21926_c0_g1_i2:448-828(-)
MAQIARRGRTERRCCDRHARPAPCVEMPRMRIRQATARQLPSHQETRPSSSESTSATFDALLVTARSMYIPVFASSSSLTPTAELKHVHQPKKPARITITPMPLLSLLNDRDLHLPEARTTQSTSV